MAVRGRRRSTAGPLAASILIHLALLAWFARQAAPDLFAPARMVGREFMVALSPSVEISPPFARSAASPQRSRSPPPLSPARKAVGARSPPLQAATAPSTGPSSSSTPSAAVSPDAGRWTVHGGAGADDGTRNILRATVGCSHEDYARLTEAERSACDQGIGREARSIGDARIDAVPAAKRAYYDAVQQAYQSMHDPRPTYNIKGEQVLPGHPPAFGCKLGGKGPPPNSLKLGPCYVTPPQGVLTEESAVAKPY